MHLLDMVMASVNVSDAITVSTRSDNKIKIKINSKEIPKENNSVVAAVNALKKYVPEVGVNIVVKKNIPLAAGLGGSSADAAGVILAFDKLFGLSKKGADLCQIAKETGSDTSYMLKGGYCRVSGVGDVVQPLGGALKLNIVLAGPRTGSLTSSVYSEFDRVYPSAQYMPTDNDSLISALKREDVQDIAANTANALYRPAINLCPDISNVVGELKRLGAQSSFMTGSGSYSVGIFLTAAEAFSATNRLRRLGYRAATACTIPFGFELTRVH